MEGPLTRPVHRCRATIAIDGPGASGKNTVGLRLARRLGYRFLDTGAMYRALTWLALQRAADFTDTDALERLAGCAQIVVLPVTEEHPQGGLLLDGEDITGDLHRPAVDSHVSLLARVPGVRRLMVEHQRRLAAGGAIVVVGRDIGTVVLPGASLKLYLTAQAAERARRRWEDLQAAGTPTPLEAVLADLERRDTLDSEREDAPLKPAADAQIVDTGTLSPEQVVELAVRALHC